MSPLGCVMATSPSLEMLEFLWQLRPLPHRSGQRSQRPWHSASRPASPSECSQAMPATPLPSPSPLAPATALFPHPPLPPPSRSYFPPRLPLCPVFFPPIRPNAPHGRLVFIYLPAPFTSTVSPSNAPPSPPSAPSLSLPLGPWRFMSSKSPPPTSPLMLRPFSLCRRPDQPSPSLFGCAGTPTADLCPTPSPPSPASHRQGTMLPLLPASLVSQGSSRPMPVRRRQ